MKRALAYLLAITLAEVVTVILQPVWGMLAYIIVMLTLVVHSALARRTVYHRLLLSLALVPLIRIVSLAMPLDQIFAKWDWLPRVWQYPIIYIPLLVATVQVVRLLGYRWSEIGFQMKRLSVQMVIALSGFVFGVVEYFILTHEAETAGPILQESWLLSAILLLVTTGFVEELMFRGVLQRSAVELFGWWGIVYISYLFAIVHLIHNSLLDIVFVFVVALFFGWVVKKTGSLFGVTLSHGVANIVLFLVAPTLF